VQVIRTTLPWSFTAPTVPLPLHRPHVFGFDLALFLFISPAISILVWHHEQVHLLLPPPSFVSLHFPFFSIPTTSLGTWWR
jgi:hypothetical protein